MKVNTSDFSGHLKRTMILQILTLSAIVSLTKNPHPNKVAFEITWSRYKNARSITVNETSYSVADEFNHIRGWKGVSVLGQNALAYTPQHVVVYDILDGLDDQYGIILVERAYHKANGDGTCGPGAKLGEPERYVFDGNTLKSSLGGGENFVTYDSNGYSVFMLDENNYSVSGPSLPDELERVFVDEDMMAIVEKDGNTIMRPISFLRPDQEEWLEEIKRSIEPVESSRRLLASFDNCSKEMIERFTSKMQAEFDEMIDCYNLMIENLEREASV